MIIYLPPHPVPKLSPAHLLKHHQARRGPYDKSRTRRAAEFPYAYSLRRLVYFGLRDIDLTEPVTTSLPSTT